MSRAEARRWLAEGQFPEGSMAPKIRAIIGYLERPERRGLAGASAAETTPGRDRGMAS